MENKTPLYQQSYEEIVETCRETIQKFVNIDPYRTPSATMENIRLLFIEIFDSMNSHTRQLRAERESAERGREILLAEIMTSIHKREDKYKEYVDEDLWDAVIKSGADKGLPKRISEDNCRRCAVITNDYKEFIELRAQLTGKHQQHQSQLDLIQGILASIANSTPKRKA